MSLIFCIVVRTVSQRTVIYWYLPTYWKVSLDCDEVSDYKGAKVIHFIRHTSRAKPSIDFALVRPTHRARFIHLLFVLSADANVYTTAHVRSIPFFQRERSLTRWVVTRNVEGGGDRNIRLMADVLHFQGVPTSLRPLWNLHGN